MPGSWRLLLHPTGAADADTSSSPRQFTKAIEDIKVGDWVLAKDPNDPGLPIPHKVIALPRNWTEHIVDVRVADGGELQATRMHPFWVEGKGWTNAVDLRSGDKLHDDRGYPISVDTVSVEDKTADTYNLTIDDVHTYYVLAGNIPLLVHNATAPPWGPPPVPTPSGAPWQQDGPQRDGMPKWTDPDSNALGHWDSEGHWDIDDGAGTRGRYDWRGNPLTPDQAHNPNKPPMPCN